MRDRAFAATMASCGSWAAPSAGVAVQEPEPVSSRPEPRPAPHRPSGIDAQIAVVREGVTRCEGILRVCPHAVGAMDSVGDLRDALATLRAVRELLAYRDIIPPDHTRLRRLYAAAEARPRRLAGPADPA